MFGIDGLGIVGWIASGAGVGVLGARVGLGALANELGDVTGGDWETVAVAMDGLGVVGLTTSGAGVGLGVAIAGWETFPGELGEVTG